MTPTPDMFPELRPPRKAPTRLMHVSDASHDCCDDQDSATTVRMRCARCGTETGWLNFRTVSDAKRGIPCPHCNPYAARG